MSKKASKNVTAASAKAGAPAHVAVARLPKVCNKFHLDVQPRFPADASLEDCTIFTVPALLTSSECQTLLAYIHANHALERVAHAQTKSIAWRNVDRCATTMARMHACMHSCYERWRGQRRHALCACQHGKHGPWYPKAHAAARGRAGEGPTASRLHHQSLLNPSGGRKHRRCVRGSLCSSACTPMNESACTANE